METRKVQRAGESSGMVSIPREWLETNDVEKGDVVRVFLVEGSVVVTPSDRAESAVERLQVDNLHRDHVSRAIVTRYVRGYDEIVLEKAGTESSRQAHIYDVVNRLTGLEIVSEDGSELRLRNLLAHGEMSTKDVVGRMHTLAELMLEDAVTAVVDADEELAASVFSDEEEFNRMYAMVVRWFRHCLREPGANEESPLPLETHFDLHACAKQLERICDHATKIAEHAGEVDDVPDATETSLLALQTEVRALLEAAIAAFFDDERGQATRRANEVLDQLPDIEESIQAFEHSLREVDAETARPLGAVGTSLLGVTEYSGSIAESALQRAAGSPREQDSDVK